MTVKGELHRHLFINRNFQKPADNLIYCNYGLQDIVPFLYISFISFFGKFAEQDFNEI